MKSIPFLSLCFLLAYLPVQSQVLKSGFDKSEYLESLTINHRAHFPIDKWDSLTSMPQPQNFRFVYRSPEVAFDNLWDFWVHRQKPLGLIAIRGSIATQVSFLANLYAAMIPAAGEIQLDHDFLFRYQLAEHPQAAVQVGWFVAMAYLSKSIVPKLDSCYQTGIKDFILTGHSQGGAITYMLTAHLKHLQKAGQLPPDIQFKTYCSASPKPGNLFFAYDFETQTVGGWAFNVINTADWVPDVPFSVQTVNDFTEVNPFRNVKTIIKRQKFPANIALKRAYRQLSKPGLKAQKNYEKYLGVMVSKAVRKQFPNYVTPDYVQSNYYVRTGTTIVLYADEVYQKHFEKEAEKYGIWHHHQPEKYLYLTEKLPL